MVIVKGETEGRGRRPWDAATWDRFEDSKR